MEIDFSSCVKKFNNYETVYNDILSLTCKYLKINANLLLSVSIINNKKIHQINKQYRDIDKPTDVISFAFLDNNDKRDSILKSKDNVVLGDIYISYEKAIEQAKIYQHSPEREMCFLFVHGLLHLLGYDHIQKEDELIMFPLQEKIINLYDGSLTK